MKKYLKNTLLILATALGLQYCAQSYRLGSHLGGLESEFEYQAKHPKIEWVESGGRMIDRRTWGNRLDKIVEVRNQFLKDNNSASYYNWNVGKAGLFDINTIGINLPKNLFGLFSDVDTQAIEKYFKGKEKGKIN